MGRGAGSSTEPIVVTEGMNRSDSMETVVRMRNRALLTVMLCLSSAVHAEMFKCTGNDGKSRYQDTPCTSGKETQKVFSIASEKDEHDPVLASLKVFNVEYLLERIEGWCASRAPATLPSVQAARNVWRRRHEQLSAKAATIVQSKLSNEARISHANQAKAENEKYIVRLEAGGPENHRQWCEALPAKTTAPEMDLMAHPVLVKTLTTYRGR